MNQIQPSIAFYFAIHHEWAIGIRLIKQIREFYSNAPIIVIADGTYNRTFASLAKKYKVKFIRDERLMLLECGGKWWQRACNAFLELSNADILIKLDPDTCLWRKFECFPDADCFGNINRRYKYPYPNGGCKGIRREAIEKIISSKILKNPRFRNQIYSYDRFGKFKHTQESIPRVALVNEDFILAYTCNHLNLSLAEWNEVNIQWRKTPSVDNFAATHPHPLV